MENISIERFTLEDLALIKDILETDFDNFWNYNILEKELQIDSSIYLCCKLNSEIIGFAGMSIILDTAELNNIVIKKTERGKGYSVPLLRKLLNIAESRGCKALNLEVASNNKVAISLYEKFGFKKVGLRPKYYNGIDALLYTQSITFH